MHFRGSPIRDKVVIVDGKKVSVFLFLIFILLFLFSSFFRVASFIQAVSKVTVLIVIMCWTTKAVAAFQRDRV